MVAAARSPGREPRILVPITLIRGLVDRRREPPFGLGFRRALRRRQGHRRATSGRGPGSGGCRMLVGPSPAGHEARRRDPDEAPADCRRWAPRCPRGRRGISVAPIWCPRGCLRGSWPTRHHTRLSRVVRGCDSSDDLACVAATWRHTGAEVASWPTRQWPWLCHVVHDPICFALNELSPPWTALTCPYGRWALSVDFLLFNLLIPGNSFLNSGNPFMVHLILRKF